MNSLPAAPSTLPTTSVVALLGNPNTGKTTLFNALSGLRQRVGNYPGVTVETKKGVMTVAGRKFGLIDLPGTYSLAARSPDEMVAVDVLLGQQAGEARPDVLVCIVDASNMERNLYLTSQALELGTPVVIALNMMDVADAQGLRIDWHRLGEELGARVVPIQANRKKGLDDLRRAIAEVAGESPSESRDAWRTRDVPASPSGQGPAAGQITEHHPFRTRERPDALTPQPHPTGAVPTTPSPGPAPAFPEAFQREVETLHQLLESRADGTRMEIPPFLVRRLLLDVGGYTEERLTRRLGTEIKSQVVAARNRLTEAGCPVPAVEARARYTWIRQLLARCVQRPDRRPVSWTDRIDGLLTHRVWGTLIFLAVMFLVFQSIYTWAGPLMDLVDAGKGAVAAWLGGILPEGPLASLVTDGIVEGVGGVLIFLPQILILFAFIAVLEDCGYMARAAFLMDKLMSRCGLSGKSFIPMLSSVACAIPGIMAARVIEDRRDRLATILVAPLMSCSARLPVYVLLIGAFLTVGYPFWVPGLVLFAMYLVGLIVAPLVALALKRTLLRGPRPVFVMEMPAYRWPSVGMILRRMGDAGWAFTRRAGTVILASMVVVWALLYFPSTHPDGGTYPEKIAELEASLEGRSEEEAGPIQEKLNLLEGEWKRQSFLGRAGHAIEPAVRPLGWDWRVGVAALASFPAREVVVGTLGIIYNLGEAETAEFGEIDDVAGSDLGQALRQARWDGEPDRPVFTVPMSLGLMVFFALCCQCASTLAVIRRESGGWRWPIFTFVYMTVLAYLGALAVYQIGQLFT